MAGTKESKKKSANQDAGSHYDANDLIQQDELWDQTPVTVADLNLDTPVTRVEGLILKANQPSILTLQGSKDLLFTSFTVTVTARKLERNMAVSAWGSSRSTVGEGNQEKLEFLLPALTTVDLLAVRMLTESNGMEIEPKENGQYSIKIKLPIKKDKSGKKEYFGYRQIALRTDAIRVSKPASGDVTVLLRSPSLPSRIGISIVDDSPVQVIPSEMAEGVTVVSRDLAGQANGAWKQAKPSVDEKVSVALKLTSMTDGQVDVEIKGAWGRYSSGNPLQVPLDSVHSVRLPVPWPFKKQSANVLLRLSGKLTEGIRQNLVKSDEYGFCVRTGEKLEVAQAFLLAEGPETAESRQVAAVWLYVPSVPKAEEKIELRVAKAAGNPPAPSDEPLARVVAVLPADSASYTREKDGFWFRAPFDTPVALDGAQLTQPFFVVAAGRAAGTLLCHRDAGGGDIDRVPSRTGATGPSLFRNLARSGSWDQQNFNRQLSVWVMDLELVPLFGEYGSVVQIAIEHKPGHEYASLTGPAATASENHWPNLPEPPEEKELAFIITSTVKGSLTAQIELYHPVKQ